MTSPADRLLVIDESLDKRLAQQLEARGRPAKSAEWLGTCGFKDDELLHVPSRLQDEPDLVLVTRDDDMPGEHAGPERLRAPASGRLH